MLIDEHLKFALELVFPFFAWRSVLGRLINLVLAKRLEHNKKQLTCFLETPKKKGRIRSSLVDFFPYLLSLDTLQIVIFTFRVSLN